MAPMLVVTLADLTYRFRQFLIAVLGAGVVFALALLMAGLVNGFTTETAQTVGGVGADRWVLTVGSNGRIAAVGVFPEADVARIARMPGVRRSDPLVILPTQVLRTTGGDITVNVVGVRVGGLGDPQATAGGDLTGNDQVVVDVRSGVAVGSHVLLGSTRFRVVGQVENRTLLAGTPMVYVPIGDAQRLALGGRPLVTAAVTTGVPTSVPPGLRVLTNQAVEQSTLAALGPAVSSINNTKLLMWAISGIIVAALVYVSALQRVRDFAVLKALGSSSMALFLSLALQAILVALAAALFAMIASQFMDGLFQQPVSIPTGAFVALPVVAVAVGLLASLVALRQATGADPAAAFGG
jgi:putative ABC transport system permease protein